MELEIKSKSNNRDNKKENESRKSNKRKIENLSVYPLSGYIKL